MELWHLPGHEQQADSHQNLLMVVGLDPWDGLIAAVCKNMEPSEIPVGAYTDILKFITL